MCDQQTKSAQIAQCLHIISFGRTHLCPCKTNSGTIKADMYMFVCSANNNCHWLLGDTTFSQPKDLPIPPPLCVLLPPAAVTTTAW